MTAASSGLTASAAGSLAIGGDLPVHRLGFGAMRLKRSSDDPPPEEREAAYAVLRRAVELGVTLIDTAPLYGASEDLIGEASRRTPTGPRRHQGRHRPRRWRLRAPGPTDQIREDCERSLRRLHLEQIPLSQLHDVDPDVPIEESVGGLAELRDEGKVRHIGLSNVDVDQLRRAQAVAPIASVQNRFSLAQRASVDVLDACAAEDIVVAIPGTGSIAHLEENVASAGLVLTDEERSALDAG